MLTKQCIQCSKTFRIDDQDLEFYKKINVPEPTHCPDCRQQRRLAWRNEHNLYARNCDLTKKSIVSIYSPDKSFTVYSEQAWWSDAWDGRNYGREFDFSRSFFEQFHDLLKVVPRLALVHPDSENSDYTHCAAMNKDCYMCFDVGYCENCYYSKTTYYARDSIDCSYCFDHCELCYECVGCYNCFNTTFAIDSYNCRDSAFLYDCRNCSNCIGCVNLRNKQYYIYNKPYSKAEYEHLARKLLPINTYSKFVDLRTKFFELKKQAIHKCVEQEHCEQCTGNYNKNSNNCRSVFGGTNNENSAFMFDSHYMKECYDCDFGGHSDTDLAYNTIGCANTHCGKFLSACWYTNNCSYCDLCMYSKNVFGCVGLRKNEYCILNKQYSKEQYEELVPKIIAYMKKTGEWGEFFPVQRSPFSYNETVAQDYYPLTKSDANIRGYRWQSEIISLPNATTQTIPDDIREVSDAICQQVLYCEITKRPYKITKQELQLYRQLGLPIPRLHPDQRHQQRLTLRNPKILWTRQCMCTQVDHSHHGRCTTEFETTYAPERIEIVYCEACYQKEIY